MVQQSQSKPSLLVKRSFVLPFCPEAEADHGRFVGRVEQRSGLNK